MLLTYGLVLKRDEKVGRNVDHQFYVMPRYGENLHDIFLKLDAKFNLRTIVRIASSVLNQFEKIHRIGFCYNDLKLDNLVVGYG